MKGVFVDQHSAYTNNENHWTDSCLNYDDDCEVFTDAWGCNFGQIKSSIGQTQALNKLYAANPNSTINETQAYPNKTPPEFTIPKCNFRLNLG